MTSSHHSGFTLLEVCLALVIAGMLVAVAIPNIAGLVAERRLKQSFERFDAMVTEARRRSVTEQRPYAMGWQKDAITLSAADSTASPGIEDKPTRLVFGKDESFHLRRPAALLPKAPAEWMFWPSGICEPAQIAFQGKAGSWLVRYDPLTTRGTFLESSVP